VGSLLGQAKERAMVMLMGDLDGVKYRPFVVYKAKPSTMPDMAIENARLRYGFGKQMWKGVNEARKEQQLASFVNLKGRLSIYFSF
jgi:hypothetical protein